MPSFYVDLVISPEILDILEILMRYSTNSLDMDSPEDLKTSR